MPQLTQVVLKDRMTTPVDHTFSPQDLRDNVGILVNTQGVPVGNERLGVSLRYTGKRYKATVTLACPVVVTETVNGVSKPSVARTAYAEVVFTYDNTSTLQERQNIVGMLANALAGNQPMLNSVLTELQSVY